MSEPGRRGAVALVATLVAIVAFASVLATFRERLS
jgi:hypothetical protein